MADKPIYYGGGKSSPMYYGGGKSSPMYYGGGKKPMYYGGRAYGGAYGNAYGSAYGAYYARLADTVAIFSKAHPGIDVQILQGSSSKLCAALEEQAVDFAIVSRREGAFEFLPLLRDPMMVWLPNGHRLAAENAVPIDVFAQEPYIATYPDQNTDNDRILHAHDIEPKTRFATIDDRATAALVRAGLGISMNNGILAQGLDLTGVTVRPLTPETIVEIGAAMPPEEHRSPAAKAFL